LFSVHSINKVIIENRDLCGTKRSAKNLILQADKVERQTEPICTNIIRDIKPGTCITCYPKHPVVDVVLFTEQKDLFFMQTTTLSYAEHHSNLPDLYRRISGTAFERKSVEKYYRECTGAKTYYFIFITTSKVKTAINSENSTHDVVLVNTDNIAAFNQDLWATIKQYY